MSAERLATEQDLRREAIDTLAVMAVHWTYKQEPPIDVNSFVSNVTGIAPEEVGARLEEITGAKGEGLLRHDEEKGRLLVNRDNEHAQETTRNFSGWNLVIGQKELSVRGLEALLDKTQSHPHSKKITDEQKNFGAGMSFDPEALVRYRGYIEKTAEHLGIKPGQSVPIQGQPVMIRARRQP